jgi:hypothetical protein
MATKESTGERGLRKFIAENSLSLFFLAIFLAALVGQAIAGHSLYNQEQLEHNESAISFWRYVGSSHFAQAVTENWQSEYLQFALFALATVWLLQKGSPESKELDQAGTETDKEQKGRTPRHEGLATVGSFGRLAHRALFELAPDRDGSGLPLLVVRAIGERLE